MDLHSRQCRHRWGRPVCPPPPHRCRSYLPPPLLLLLIIISHLAVGGGRRTRTRSLAALGQILGSGMPRLAGCLVLLVLLVLVLCIIGLVVGRWDRTARGQENTLDDFVISIRGPALASAAIHRWQALRALARLDAHMQWALARTCFARLRHEEPLESPQATFPRAPILVRAAGTPAIACHHDDSQAQELSRAAPPMAVNLTGSCAVAAHTAAEIGRRRNLGRSVP